MLKRILVLLLCICIPGACFGACAEKSDVLYENDQYFIFSEDDKCYLRFHQNGTAVETSGSAGCAAGYYPAFNTAVEMKAAIISGDMPQLCIQTMQSMSNSAGNLEITNPLEIYDLILPNGVMLESISWQHDKYKCYFAGKALSGNVTFYTKEQYSIAFKKYYETHIGSDDTLDAEYYDTKKDIYVVEYHDPYNHEYKKLFNEYQINGRAFNVALQITNTDEIDYFYIFGQEEDAYYSICVDSYGEGLLYDFLCEFDIERITA